jgi:truncated hemoglobin YjbI
MRTLSRWGPLVLAALVLAAAGVGRAADEKTAGPMDRKALDAALYNNLKDVVNRGAALYNSGDQAGCYRLFEGALMTVRPLLAHHPELQKAVDDALKGAEQDPMLSRRAFMLRAALDKVRADIKPREAAAGAPAPGAGGPPPGGGTGARPKTDSAWTRMGGLTGVRKIVNDLAEAVTKDPKVDFFRGGKYNPTPAEVAHMKQMIVEQISSATGGPLAYEGKSMVDVHKDMGITNTQFDAFVEDFKEVLRKNNVDAKDAADLVSKIEATRNQIVRPKPAPGAGGEKKKPRPAAGALLLGKITFEGKPLPGGEVALYDKDGKALKGTVNADGSYQVKDVPPGTYTMTVKTDDKDVKIPKTFGDPKTSGLRLEVQAGNNTHDIVLNK